jgi:hypothetical protein
MSTPYFVIIDRPGASSGCACGGATDSELPRFAGDLEWLRWQSAIVRRLDPRFHRQEMEADADVRAAIEQLGLGSLPLVLVDGVVVHIGSYPTREALATYLSTPEL